MTAFTTVVDTPATAVLEVVAAVAVFLSVICAAGFVVSIFNNKERT